MVQYLIAQIVPALATGSSFSWFFCPFYVSPIIVVNTSLFFGTTRCSRLTLNLSCPNPRINHFFNKPWFLLLEDDIRNQQPDAWLDIRICHSNVQ